MISVYVFGEIINWALFSPTYMLGVTPEGTPNVVPSEYAEYELSVNIIMIIVEILLSVYLIRKWSKAWNKKFETPLNSS